LAWKMLGTPRGVFIQLSKMRWCVSMKELITTMIAIRFLVLMIGKVTFAAEFGMAKVSRN